MLGNMQSKKKELEQKPFIYFLGVRGQGLIQTAISFPIKYSITENFGMRLAGIVIVQLTIYRNSGLVF